MVRFKSQIEVDCVLIFDEGHGLLRLLVEAIGERAKHAAVLEKFSSRIPAPVMEVWKQKISEWVVARRESIGEVDPYAAVATSSVDSASTPSGTPSDSNDASKSKSKSKKRKPKAKPKNLRKAKPPCTVPNPFHEPETRKSLFEAIFGTCLMTSVNPDTSMAELRLKLAEEDAKDQLLGLSITNKMSLNNMLMMALKHEDKQ